VAADELAHYRRLEAERGYLRAALRLTPSSEGGRKTPLRTGYRANWRLGKDDVQAGAPITIEDREWLEPGAEAVVRLHPMFPEYWESVVAGARITMYEGSRRVGTATVLDVVPPPTP
jgi:translation elongation factor EF-Tu-like GTPase